MSSPESLLVGRVLADRYHIVEPIGRGGMGAVYRANDARLDRTVAVKVISVEATHAEQRSRLRTRFHREARAAARLHHPNVVAVFDFGTDPALDIDFLVMELLDGEDLAKLVEREGPFAGPHALEILRQAAQGLAAGHQAGLIHRDIKPANLFLTQGSPPAGIRVFILDFGIALPTASDATMTHVTQAGRAPLSPAFASPEQHRGYGDIAPASDVFSLGVTGFYLLTGRRPFTPDQIAALAGPEPAAVPSLRHLQPDVPPELDAALRRAMSPHPAHRFADAGAFLAALPHSTLSSPARLHDRTLEVSTGPAPSGPTPAPRRWPSVRRPSRRSVLIGISAVAVLGIGTAAARALHAEGFLISDSSAWQRCQSGAGLEAPAAPGPRVLARACARALDAAELTDEQRVTAHRTRIAALRQLGRDADVVPEARAWARLRPRDPDAFFALGEALHRTRHQEEALWAFEQVLAIDPTRAEARFRAAVVLRTADREREALRELEAVVAADPAYRDRAAFQQELASVLFVLGRHRESLAAHRRVTELEPGWVDGWGNLGLAAHLAGNHAEAVDAYAEALRRDPAYLDSRPDHRDRWAASRRRAQSP